MQGAYTVASSSASATYGNVACVVREQILSKFADGFFRSRNIASEAPFRNMRRQFFELNSTEELHKRMKPYISIQPTYGVTNSNEIAFQDIPLTNNYDNMEYGIDKRFLLPILYDSDNGYSLKYKFNRDRLEFEVTLSVSTFHQQIDLWKSLLNQIRWERPTTYRAALEHMIPRSMISYYSKLVNMDIDNSNTNVIPILLHRLNQNSKYPITYKIKNASGKDEFFLYYNHLLMMNFYDLDKDTGSKKGMVDDVFTITFRVWVEFNIPGLFILMKDSSAPDYEHVKMDIVTRDGNGSPDEYFPVYSVSNLHQRFPGILNGKSLYVSSIFNTEKHPNTNKDFLDIRSLLEEDLIGVLKSYAGYNESLHAFIDIYILKDDICLTESIDYWLNWNRMGVILNRTDPFATYRIFIYIDRDRINENIVEDDESHSTEIMHPLTDRLPWSILEDGKYTELVDTDPPTSVYLYDGEELSTITDIMKGD